MDEHKKHNTKLIIIVIVDLLIVTLIIFYAYRKNIQGIENLEKPKQTTDTTLVQNLS